MCIPLETSSWGLSQRVNAPMIFTNWVQKESDRPRLPRGGAQNVFLYNHVDILVLCPKCNIPRLCALEAGKKVS